MKTKTILILANSSTGLYDFRKELVRELTKEYQVYVSLPEREAGKQLEEEGCRILDTKINRRGMNPLQDLCLLWDYLRLMKRLQPDCVLTYTIKPNLYGGLAAGWCKIPFIPTITGLGTAFQKQGIVNRLVKRLYRTSFLRADVVFFQNEVNRNRFMHEGLITGAVRVVSGSGVNLMAYPAKPYPGRKIPKLLYVGRLMKEKGIEEFLTAAKTYAGQAEFVVVGAYEEDYHSQVEQGAAEGWLNYQGKQRQMQPYYEDADGVVIPSYHEGMSNVLLEAAASARPVLATNISGCREAVEAGKTGLLFLPKSKEALLEAVGHFLGLSQKEREEMGKAARRKMEEEFDRNQVVRTYLQEIHRIQKGRKR